MRILLISPLLTRRKPFIYNIGLSYIGSALIQAGHDVELLDIEAYKYSNEEVEEAIRKNKAEVICIGTLVTGFNYVDWLCTAIKNIKPNVPVIIGNSIATTIPEILLENVKADYLVLGEGELTIVELVNAISNKYDISGIKGIAYRNNSKIIIAEPRELILDLDSIPFPARHLFPLKEVYFKNASSSLKPPIGVVSTTRGCPYKCTYCYHAFQNQRIRFHSAERVVDEIEYLVKEYNIRSLGFSDDLFVIKKSRVFEIFDLLEKRNIKINWRASCRVNFFDDELIKRMKRAGCVEIGIGIESGSQKILNNIHKQSTVEQAQKALQLCKKYDIHPYTSYMIGNVGETRESVYKTIEFRKKYDPGMGGFFFTTPYPDTPLYRYAIEKKLIRDELSLIKSYGEQSARLLVNFTEMTNAELVRLKKEANKELIKDYLIKHPIKGGWFLGKTLAKKYLNAS